jgi:hypothetical protein
VLACQTALGRGSLLLCPSFVFRFFGFKRRKVSQCSLLQRHLHIAFDTMDESVMAIHLHESNNIRYSGIVRDDDAAI